MGKKNNLMIRVNDKEKEIIEDKAKKFGFHTMSEYLRYVGVNTKNIKIITKND